MAAGDITRDTGGVRRSGNLWESTGSIEVDDTKRAYALTGTTQVIIDCMLIDEDGVGSAQLALNQNASGTATNGTIAVMGNHQSVETYRFIARFV